MIETAPINPYALGLTIFVALEILIVMGVLIRRVLKSHA
jgi:hypothetical protein